MITQATPELSVEEVRIQNFVCEYDMLYHRKPRLGGDAHRMDEILKLLNISQDEVLGLADEIRFPPKQRITD